MLGSLARSTWEKKLNVSIIGSGESWACRCSRSLYLAVACVDAGEVDFADEGNIGRRVGVLWATVNLERVDAVFVNAL